MPKRSDIESILVVGAGPIVIGQACEFDYSGTQACKALAEEGFPGGAGELQPGHHHDRPRTRRCDLHRAGALEGRRADHREGTPRRPAAHDGRPDRPQLLTRPRARGGAGGVRRRARRGEPRGDRQGRGPRAVPRRDGPHRARMPARGAGPRSGAGRRRAGGRRLPTIVRPSFTLGGTAGASRTTARSSWRSASAGSKRPPPPRC